MIDISKKIMKIIILKLKLSMVHRDFLIKFFQQLPEKLP